MPRCSFDRWATNLGGLHLAISSALTWSVRITSWRVFVLFGPALLRVSGGNIIGPKTMISLYIDGI